MVWSKRTNAYGDEDDKARSRWFARPQPQKLISEGGYGEGINGREKNTIRHRVSVSPGPKGKEYHEHWNIFALTRLI